MALIASLPSLGGLGFDDGIVFRARIDCDVKAEDGKSRLSFLFPEPDVPLAVDLESDISTEAKFAVLVLSTASDGKSFASWTTASDVVPRPIIQPKDSKLPAPPIFRPLIQFGNGSFENLTPKDGRGMRWSYYHNSISSHGISFKSRGQCKLTNYMEGL
ncbi:hypothetical protein [Sphingobium fluviale]|uniref:Uncharacterized protein n=1 Tax=Sphingobium fluviale TaxID=2506423 RepID=A0A4Q1KJP0_9SPHN|nr:hypothetical protein [Sphingobium fluviale]RXR29978.1 hypothetical protein EQG66_05460 [Sphingobium fluviale]